MGGLRLHAVSLLLEGSCGLTNPIKEKMKEGSEQDAGLGQGAHQKVRLEVTGVEAIGDRVEESHAGISFSASRNSYVLSVSEVGLGHKTLA